MRMIQFEAKNTEVTFARRTQMPPFELAFATSGVVVVCRDGLTLTNLGAPFIAVSGIKCCYTDDGQRLIAGVRPQGGTSSNRLRESLDGGDVEYSVS